MKSDLPIYSPPYMLMSQTPISYNKPLSLSILLLAVYIQRFIPYIDNFMV